MTAVAIEIEEGGVLLCREEAQMVRRALVIGLACWSEVERVRTAIDAGVRHEGLKLPDDICPLHPTGDDSVTGSFADALQVML